jgi:hypothetical protein
MSAPALPRRIHITGAPRSGTTLLHVLFLTCFDIDGRVEEEQRLRRPVPPGARVTCTKCPGEVEAAAAIARLDARLDVIHVRRDPRDVITSRHDRHPGRYFTNIRVWRRAERAAARALGQPRFHIVDYERLVRDPDAVQQALMDAMPWLRPVALFSQYHLQVAAPNAEWTRAMRDIRPITDAGVGGWVRHLARIKGQERLHGQLGEELVALGYERDHSWMALLRDVTPDLTPSVNPERLSLRRAVSQRLPRLRDMALYFVRRPVRSLHRPSARTESLAA